jgi:hypothetical protein
LRWSAGAGPFRIYGGFGALRWIAVCVALVAVIGLPVYGFEQLTGIGPKAQAPPKLAVPLHCISGTEPTLDAWHEYKCPNYDLPECPDGSQVSQGNWQGVNTVSCDGRVIATIR